MRLIAANLAAHVCTRFNFFDFGSQAQKCDERKSEPDRLCLMHHVFLLPPVPYSTRLDSNIYLLFLFTCPVQIERLIHNVENSIRLARMRSEDMPPAAPVNLPIIVNLQPPPALLGTEIL